MYRTIAILSGSLFMLGGVAYAAEPVHEFECDTPAGHFSFWSQTLKAGKLTVTGTVDINEKREHERWNPAASILLVGNPNGTLGLQIYTLSTQKDVFNLRITEPQTKDEAPFAKIPADTTSIPFSLSLAKDGKLTVTAAGKSASTTIKGFKPRKLQLSCSTGDFFFRDFTISQ